MPTDRVAVITGAGSGIGRHVALSLLRDGFHVVLAGRREQPLQDAAKVADTCAADALAVPTDVSDADSVQSLFKKTADRFGRLDLLFNNAGIFVPAASLENMPISDWQRSVDVNLTGAFLCTQQAFLMMKSQDPMGGRIINNGSISAYVPRPNSVAYTATKHAITGLTKSTSLDGRKYNIACSQIDIGNAATDMTKKMKKGVMQANGEIQVEPTFDLDHVAAAVLQMANLPLDANIQFMTIMATQMPYIGRG